MPLLLVLEGNETMNPPCPACNGVLVEIRAGLYCYNKDCTHYKQKVIACCEGGAC